MSSSSFSAPGNSFARVDARAIPRAKTKLSVSAATFPDVVLLQRLTEAADADAGPREEFDVPGTPLSCTITATKLVKQSYAADQEVGVTPVLIGFADDPGASKGDRLIWDGRIIRLLAPARPEAGSGSLYLAQGEIRD